MANYHKSGDQTLVASAGQMLAEHFHSKGKSDVLKESFGILKEAGQTTTTNSGAYVDLLSTTLYQQAIDRMQDILDLVYIDESLKNSNGFGAMQIPKLTPTIAVEVAEGAVTQAFPEGIGSITVTCQKVVAQTKLTWEIQKRGMTGFVTYVLQNAADAVRRKLSSDIVNGLAAMAAHSETGISYANILNLEAKVNSAKWGNGVPFGFLADRIVFDATNWAVARNDTDIKAAMSFASVVPGQPVNAATEPLFIGNLKVVSTPFLTAAKGLILESKKNILVKESDLETVQGRLPNSADDEILAIMSYVLAGLFPESVGKLV